MKTWHEDNRWTVLRHGERLEFDVSHRLYAATELQALAREVGFQETEVFGDPYGSPYDDDADLLVLLARR